MLYEFRTYTVAPGRMHELRERFREHTLRLFAKHDIHTVLFCMPKDGLHNNTFIYILKFRNVEHMQKAWQSFVNDEERQRIWDESNKNGKLVTAIQSDTYDAVDFS